VLQRTIQRFPNPVTGTLDLPYGSSITWDERNGEDLSIPAPWTLGWSGILPTGGAAPVFTLDGEHTVEFSVFPSGARLTLDGVELFWTPMSGIPPSLPIRVVVTPREIHVFHAVAKGGLVPRVDLYPSGTLYPDGGIVTWRRVRYPLTWVQPEIRSITLHGKQLCHWLTVIAGEAGAPVVNSMLVDLDCEPSWTLDTWFLASFDQGLDGGNITPAGDTIAGVALYRRARGRNRLQLVAQLDIGTSELIDEGFRNQETYTYYVFVLGEKTYVSAPLQNFTPYPTRQPSSYNYQSSTLTGYIGKVDYVNSRYSDTVEMADELRALSVSTDPKFLRDRKGGLWRIETGAAVSFQTGDNQVPQPYFGTFPWVETGSVDGVSIISGEGDWNGGTKPVDAAPRPSIVVTAEPGALVTIIAGGRTVLSQVSIGYVSYLNPAYGTYIVRAGKGGRTVSATVRVQQPVTYYVGLVFEERTVIECDAPSGSIVTVAGNGFSEKREVP